MNKTLLWSLTIIAAFAPIYFSFRYENGGYSASELNIKTNNAFDNASLYLTYNPDDRIVDNMALRNY